MKTTYKDYGVTASITDHHNGTATLKIQCAGKVIKNKEYASRKSAYNAWRRFST